MRIVPARNGWQWLIAGLRLYARSPLGWMAMVLLYWLSMLLLNAVPWIGPIAGTIALPAFSVSFMAMAREVEAGRRLLPLMLFAGFARHRLELLILGVVYFFSLIASLAFSMLADGGLLARYMLLGETSSEAEGSMAIAWAGVLAMLAYTPVLMAYWFAPVLAAWEDMPPAKSLFFSFFAVWRNWRPFLVYGLGAVALSVPVLLLFALVAGVVAGLGQTNLPDQDRLLVGAVFAAPLLLSVAAVLIASFYASYRDLFPPASPEAAPQEPAPQT